MLAELMPTRCTYAITAIRHRKASKTYFVLNARSGPWMGAIFTPGPQFAAPLEEAASPYLLAARMTHTYRFRVDRPMPTVFFEVHLKDSDGRHLKTLKFPDAKANFWVRHR